jgi:hypothetical protein
MTLVCGRVKHIPFLAKNNNNNNIVNIVLRYRSMWIESIISNYAIQ